MVLRSIDHRMQLFPMDTNQQCYVCNVSPKSSYLDIFHRIDNNRPDSAQSASGKDIYNKKKIDHFPFYYMGTLGNFIPQNILVNPLKVKKWV